MTTHFQELSQRLRGMARHNSAPPKKDQIDQTIKAYGSGHDPGQVILHGITIGQLVFECIVLMRVEGKVSLVCGQSQAYDLGNCFPNLKYTQEVLQKLLGSKSTIFRVAYVPAQTKRMSSRYTVEFTEDFSKHLLDVFVWAPLAATPAATTPVFASASSDQRKRSAQPNLTLAPPATA